jgi:hypothetical protein
MRRRTYPDMNSILDIGDQVGGPVLAEVRQFLRWIEDYSTQVSEMRMSNETEIRHPWPLYERPTRHFVGSNCRAWPSQQ